MHLYLYIMWNDFMINQVYIYIYILLIIHYIIKLLWYRLRFVNIKIITEMYIIV